jgi:dolichol kinase
MGKIAKKINETKRLIDSIDFDVHWYRRVCHAFGAAFLIYYLLPDVDWINLLKFWVPILVLIIVLIIEILRLKGKIGSEYFFGLRMYEEKRVGSYVFFTVAIIILFRFPQQIAIPCILCACLADPIMGEIRHRYGKKQIFIVGFLVCLFLFMVTWYKADIRLMLLVSIVGATGAIIGETKKFWWLDDDFMIQMLPAVLLLIIWVSLPHLGFAHPDPIIYPGPMPW